MSTFVPTAVQDGLDAARIKKLKSASRLRIETDDGYFRILRLWETGFSVAAEDAPQLRGYVDIYDRSQHLFQCLIVADEEGQGEVCYEFKRMTAVAKSQPKDFAPEKEAAVGLLTAIDVPG